MRNKRPQSRKLRIEHITIHILYTWTLWGGFSLAQLTFNRESLVPTTQQISPRPCYLWAHSLADKRQELRPGFRFVEGLDLPKVLALSPSSGTCWLWCFKHFSLGLSNQQRGLRSRRRMSDFEWEQFWGLGEKTGEERGPCGVSSRSTISDPLPRQIADSHI